MFLVLSILVCIVEVTKPVAISAAASMIVHAKKVSKELVGKALILLYEPVFGFNPRWIGENARPKTIEDTMSDT